MKKLILVIWLAGLAILAAACGGDDEDIGTLPLTDQQLLDQGWSAFASAQYDQALASFDELVDRGALLAEAHSGRGWSYARSNLPSEAAAALDSASAQQPAGDLADEIQAGYAFVHDALDRHADCLAATDQVSEGWIFAHDAAVDYDDLIVLRYYALGQFAESLAEVQRLDPEFTADVATPAGRAALAAKIEQLLG